MNKTKWFFGVLCATSLLGYAQKQVDSTKVEYLDEVVLTDSKFKLKRENSGKVITKISQEELQNLKGRSIAEIINATSGIEINGTKSNAGQNLAYYVRGGRNRQVLVLIDGIALTDPSQISNDYDLRLLNADQVESIEILKGAASTLYGTGAATAVINVTLKKAAKESVKANFQSIIGTNQSQNEDNFALNDFRNNISFNGTLNKFNYLASFGNQYTSGLSAISSGTERDAFNAINGNLKLGYQINDAFKINTYASFDKFKAEFDDAFSNIDTDDLSRTNQYRFGINSEYIYKNGSVTLNGAYNNVERTIQSSFPAEFYSNSFVGDLFNRYSFNDKIFTVIGLNVQQNEMESFVIPFGSSNLQQSIDPNDATFTILDPYLNLVYISDFGLNINAGARLNNHSEYGSHLVYNFNPSYRKNFNFGYIKALASYSTAYITPSLYQLYEPTYGNADLMPEENATIEGGFEVSFKDKGLISIVYFNRKEENFVDFVDLGNFVFQYNNIIEKFTASGFEFTLNYNILPKLDLNANATYTKVEEELNLRIPKLKINTKLDYKIFESTFLSLSYQFNDERNDVVFNSSTFTNDDVLLDSYSILDFYVSHAILNNKLKLFANLTNILNEEYQEISGFSTRGRNINLGFNLSI